MVDSRGRLIGINTLMTGPEVGVAVPVHVAVQFLKTALGHSRPAPQGGPTVMV
jgi:S1-C subfamily serine protease